MVEEYRGASISLSADEAFAGSRSGPSREASPGMPPFDSKRVRHLLLICAGYLIALFAGGHRHIPPPPRSPASFPRRPGGYLREALSVGGADAGR